MIWVALAGPGTNITLAVIAAQFLKLGVNPFLAQTLMLAVGINLLLAIFNLIPIPPLDGSRIVIGLLPLEWTRFYRRLEPFGLMIVIALIYMDFGLFDFILRIVFFLMILLGINPHGF